MNNLLYEGGWKMKPLIGIIPSVEVNDESYMVSTDNVQAIIQAGGIPVILPFFSKISDVDQIIETIDGLYMTGGYDIDPMLFDEEPHQCLGTVTPMRDTFEMICIHQMLEHRKPILGVCRGSQILNIAVGGNMYQDIYAQNDSELLQHTQQAPKGHGSHFVHVKEGSLLGALTGVKKLLVNSRHHQANRQVSDDFQVSGKASDGVVEAIESKKHPFVLGLQWHPENMLATGDKASLRIFQGFIKACQLRKAEHI